MYRAEAARPVERTRTIVAERGRILARDGTVLACDRPVLSLAMQYRWLEEPPDPAWLRHIARAHLTAAERRDSCAHGSRRKAGPRFSRSLHRRLAELCGVRLSEWQDRCRTIQSPRASALRSCESSRDRRSPRSAAKLEGNFVRRVMALIRRPQIVEWPDPQFHAASPDDFRGRAIAGPSTVRRLVAGCRRGDRGQARAISRRAALSAIVADPIPTACWRRICWVSFRQQRTPRHEEEQLADGAGRAGVERQYDAILRGAAGREVDTLDHHGQTITSRIVRSATAGQDLQLTLDSELQRTAETLLDAALARRLPELDTESDREKSGDADGSAAMSSNGGGAILAMDVRTGAILAAASAPRFDPASCPIGIRSAKHGAAIATRPTIHCSTAACKWRCLRARFSKRSRRLPC